MNKSKGIIEHLGFKIAKIFLFVYIFLIVVSGYGFYYMYKMQVVNEAKTIIDLKRITIAKVISRKSDDERISLNYSLEEFNRLRQIILFDSNNSILYRHMKSKTEVQIPVNGNVKDTKIDFSIFKGPIVSGEIKFNNNVSAFYTMAFSNVMQKTFVAYYIISIFFGLGIFYVLYIWSIKNVARIFSRKINEISHAIDSYDLSKLDEDDLFEDLRAIINSNKKIILNLNESIGQLNEASLVCKIDLDGKVTNVNEKFCILSKYSKEEIIGCAHSITYSDIHTEVFWDSMWSTVKSGHIWKGEVANKAKDNSIYWSESTIIPTKDINNKVIGYAELKIDITEQKKASRKLQYASKMASIGELAAGIGHQINNPLSVSLGSISLIEKIMEKNNIHNEKIIKFLGKMKFANTKIANIVEGLRTYAKSDAYRKELISVNDAISQTVNLISESYSQRGISLLTKVTSEELYVNGSMGKLQQVVLNLLSNAIDATADQDKKEIEVRLECTSEKEAILTVSDNGRGLSDEAKSKAFDAYYSIKREGRKKGVGLGLVKELVEKMNGEIQIESKLDNGSKFIIKFPILKQSKILEEVKDSINPTKLTGSILVVDDEDDVREIIISYAESLGLVATGASCALDALELVKKHEYDYISTDMRMPEIQGDEFIERSKKLPNGKTKYIIITGDADTVKTKNNWSNLLDLADCILRKPFSEEEIFKAIKLIDKG